MTSKSQVTITFAGDASDLSKAVNKVTDDLNKVSDSVDNVSVEIDNSYDRFDRSADAFGDLDTRAMGFRDGITGVTDVLAAYNDESLTTSERAFVAAAGVGDLASSMENLVIPVAKAAVQHTKLAFKWIANNGRMLVSNTITAAKSAAVWAASAARAAAATIASVARQVAAWVLLGVQSLIAAAKVAAAWLISLGPIAIVIAAVIGLVALIIIYWDEISAVIEAGWNWIKEKTIAVWNAIYSAIEEPLKQVIAYVRQQVDRAKTVIRVAWNVIKAVTSAAWDAIRVTIRTVVSWILKYFRTQLAIAKTVIKVGFIVIRTIVTTVLNTIKNIVTAVWNKVTSDIRKAINTAKRIFNAFKRTTVSIFRAVGQGIIGPIRSALSGIRRAWNSTIGGKGVRIPSVMGFGGANFTIPRLAEGGIIKPTSGGSLFVGGEAGQHEAVIPLNRLDRMLSGGGSRSVVEIRSNGNRVSDMLLELLRESVASRGGDVQLVIGSRGA